MVLKGITKIGKANTTSNTRVIRIPLDVFNDSVFPFKDNEPIKIEIVNGTVVLSKPNNDKLESS